MSTTAQHLVHVVLALLVQWLVVCLPPAWAGAVAGTLVMLMREVTQHEYRVIGPGQRSSMPMWAGLDVAAWSGHSRAGVLLPLVACTLVALLAGCGGGGSAAEPSRPVVGVYGDSLASGHIAVPPGRLDVPPARRLQEMLGDRALVVDYAQPGARVADALAGAGTMPMGPFSQHLAATRPDVVVLRFGGADALLGTPPDVFGRDLAQLVALSRAQGATVVLVGLPHHPLHDGALQALDAAAAALARAGGLRWVDLQAVPLGGLADGTHPGQAYADLLTARIDAAVVAALRPP